MFETMVQLITLALAVAGIVGGWMAFKKAGYAGWLFVIPILNLIVMLRIAGRPLWWLLLYLIPVVNILIAVVVAIGIAKSFRRSALFGLGLLVFAPVFWFMLGFSKEARYLPPARG